MQNLDEAIETPFRLLDSSLDGWIKANSGLILLKQHRTILRRDYRTLDKVRILTGGWSGYEPMFPGFVGPGMCTAAIMGEKFNCPPYPSILAAIRELDSSYGIIVIIMNHPSLILNFNIAVSIASRENIPVNLLIVSDDCSGYLVETFGRNGTAGISFMLKIAGSMSENGQTFAFIYDTCANLLNGNVSTINMGITNEQFGFNNFSNDIQIEEGLNKKHCNSSSPHNVIMIKPDFTDISKTPLTVHKFNDFSDLTEIMLKYLIGDSSQFSIPVEINKSIAVFFNNFGNFSNLYLNSLASEFVKQAEKRKIKVARIFIGSALTCKSLSISISVMKVNSKILTYLDHPTDAICWPRSVRLSENFGETPSVIAGKHDISFGKIKCLGPILSENAGKRVFHAVNFAVLALISCEDQINKVGAAVSQSMYGTYIHIACEAISRALNCEKLNVTCPYALLQNISMLTSYHIPGSAGSTYAVFFDGASQVFAQHYNDTEVTMQMWTDALEKGISAIEFYTKLKIGDGSVLDTLYPVLEVMKSWPESYSEIAEAAEKWITQNKYTVASKTEGAGTKRPLDPGSHTVTLWVRAVVEGLNSFVEEPIKDPDSKETEEVELECIITPCNTQCTKAKT